MWSELVNASHSASRDSHTAVQLGYSARPHSNGLLISNFKLPVLRWELKGRVGGGWLAQWIDRQACRLAAIIRIEYICKTVPMDTTYWFNINFYSQIIAVSAYCFTELRSW